MSIFQLATVLIYVTSVLTLTVNDGSAPEQSPTTDLKKLSPAHTATRRPTLLTDTRSENVNASTVVSNSGAKEGIFTEGGRVVNAPYQVKTKSSTNAADFTEDKLPLGVKLPPTSHEIFDLHEGGRGSVPRKGVENKKTVGKKGVIDPMDLDTEKSMTADQVTPAKTFPDVEEKSMTKMPVVETNPILPPNASMGAKSTRNNTGLDKQVESIGTKTIPNVLLVPGKSDNTTTHKRKPTFTTGEGDDDGKGMPSSPTQVDIGMPRKVDYIIPVVITIMATPVLGIAAFVLYTRGRDCWEKRHYRRMDFLIDGMYND